MRSRRFATRTWLPLSAALLLAGCASADYEALVTPTPIATKAEPALTLTSADGTTFTPGKPAKNDALRALHWNAARVEDGRLALRFRDPNACGRIDHVTVGPPDGGVRRVTVMAEYVEDACDDIARTIVLDTPFSASTIVTPSELDIPDKRLTANRDLAGANPVLQPDRRSVVLAYTHGSCHLLAAAGAKVEGKRLIVWAEIGSNPAPMPEDMGCGGAAYFGHTLIRLPRPAPEGAELMTAWCLPGRKGCSI